MFNPIRIDAFYGELLSYLLKYGDRKMDRTGTGTLSLTGGSVRFNLADSFPVLSLKRTAWLTSFKEMEWFTSGGCDNIQWLRDQGITIWDKWADDKGNLGPVYGCMWRAWPVKGDDGIVRHIDQLNKALSLLLMDPYSRRNIVEGWNPELLPDTHHVDGTKMAPRDNPANGKMALPPCHKSFQLIVRGQEKQTLDLVLYLRSSDAFLGLPFNIAQYAYLTHLIARWAGMHVGHLIIHLGDVHLYLDHVDQAQEVVRRWTSGVWNEAETVGPAPQLLIACKAPRLPWDVSAGQDVNLVNYMPLPHIKGNASE